jgi:hypothetical protein|tara:strand:- start:370 stop:528 length:159 start_codon:yes stop_codon:yes gene_type:complete
MKYFITLDEDLLLKLWLQDPTSVIPFSRPYMAHKHNDEPNNNVKAPQKAHNK